MQCPVCNIQLDLDDAVTHIITEHQLFMVTYLSMYNIIDNLDGGDAALDASGTGLDAPSMTYNENNDYEYLSELCERMGNHTIGLSKEDIDEHAPITLIDSDKKENCPICLESISTKIYLRRLKICKHLYCAECIEKWFESKHTCPVCKYEIEVSTAKSSATKVIVSDVRNVSDVSDVSDATDVNSVD